MKLMDKATMHIDPVEISQFYDKELGPEDDDRARKHIDSCPICSDTFEDLKDLSERVGVHIFSQYSETDGATAEENVLKGIDRKNIPWWKRGRGTFFSKRTLIPVTTMAALIIALFTVLRPAPVPGPSAIISSLTTSMSSVIIMETPKTRQTILWFNELK